MNWKESENEMAIWRRWCCWFRFNTFIVGIVQVIGRKKAAAETPAPAAKTPVEKFNLTKARSKSSNCKSNSRNARFNRGSRSRRNH